MVIGNSPCYHTHSPLFVGGNHAIKATYMLKNRDSVEEMDIRLRIKQAIESKGMKIKQFSRESGMAYPSLRDYHGGKRKPGFDALAEIVAFTGVSADWVLLGKGQMFTDEPPPFAPVDERLMAQIAQRVVLAFSAPETKDGLTIEELESYRASGDPEVQHELNIMGEQAVIASTIYNKVALIEDETERDKAISGQVALLVHLRRSIDATRLGA